MAQQHNHSPSEVSHIPTQATPLHDVRATTTLPSPRLPHVVDVRLNARARAQTATIAAPCR